jgi:hypothetical protein
LLAGMILKQLVEPDLKGKGTIIELLAIKQLAVRAGIELAKPN